MAAPTEVKNSPVGEDGDKSAAKPHQSIPKDVQIIKSILSDMGVTEYEPRVENQMLEFTYRYVTNILEEARIYQHHAGKKNIDVEDLKLAVQQQLDHSFTSPPPRDFLLEIARKKNNEPLPVIKAANGLRLPPDRYCLSSVNYRLKPLHKKTSVAIPQILGGQNTVLTHRLQPSTSSSPSVHISRTTPGTVIQRPTQKQPTPVINIIRTTVQPAPSTSIKVTGVKRKLEED